MPLSLPVVFCTIPYCIFIFIWLLFLWLPLPFCMLPPAFAIWHCGIFCIFALHPRAAASYLFAGSRLCLFTLYAWTPLWPPGFFYVFDFPCTRPFSVYRPPPCNQFLVCSPPSAAGASMLQHWSFVVIFLHLLILPFFLFCNIYLLTVVLFLYLLPFLLPP